MISKFQVASNASGEAFLFSSCQN